MKKIGDLLPGVLKELQTPEKELRRKLVDSWRAIAGPKIAPHSKPSLSPDGTLFVWVDQASLACELNQKYSGALLKRVQAVLGEKNVKKIYIRVGQLR